LLFSKGSNCGRPEPHPKGNIGVEIFKAKLNFLRVQLSPLLLVTLLSHVLEHTLDRLDLGLLRQQAYEEDGEDGAW